ncbi:short-chain dehydrogenase [Lactiplantibacillus plantarum EGD-AQ4]|nr:short-chain dehydrogenase [Lactiplantibacillus plantarum EGD-AQ4]
MKIAMLGSLGHINRIVVPQLIQTGHEVTVISTNPERQATIEALGAHAAIGTMTDGDFLTRTFTGQDVVYLMLSGSTGDDLFKSAVTQAQIWKHAIEAAGVHNVVNLSSIGADAGEVAGSLHAYHLIETELRQLQQVNLTFVRPTGFYANLFSNLATIKADHAIYSNIPADIPQKYVAPEDIARVVLPLLTAAPAGVTVKYAFSDTFTGDQFVADLREALNMPDLRWVQISDAQYQANLTNHGVSAHIAQALVQTSRYQRDPDGLYADLNATHTIPGQVVLADFVRTFVVAYNSEGGYHSNTIAD